MSDIKIQIAPFAPKYFDYKGEIFIPIILTIMVLVVGIVGVKFGYISQILILLSIFGIPVALYAFYNLKFGIILVICLAFFVLGIKRLVGDIPLGLLLDSLIALMVLSLVIQLVRKRNWEFANNQISLAVLVWVIYNLLEVVNPWAESIQAWLYTVRSMAGLMVLYFIVLYAMDNIKYAKWLIKLWILLATLAAVHGLNQEYLGFLPFEERWVFEDQERFALLFQMGRFRKFSFMSDAMIFGFVMAYSAVLCFVLASGPHKLWERVALIVAGCMMVLSMVYSGTRAAYILLPVGGFFYVILTFQKKIIVLSLFCLALGFTFINMPTSNINIIRVQSAFKPSEDASFNTRKRNQKMIQPYLWTHPMGGGLGSTGDWGEKFSPNSFLSKFPPDSGYMRIVVEMGPIGLIIYLYLMFVVLKEGIRNYFAIKNPKLKNLMLAVLCVVYSLVIANFPQEATGQIPNSLLLYVMFALICKLPDFDKNADSI
ncbi:MAG: O-antigen ligase family protein [Bacteroidota bacterium]|nr:O-antigen ligase family protein [Bacteroidota bacterium]